MIQFAKIQKRKMGTVASTPKIIFVFVSVKIYQLKSDLKMIQVAAEIAEPIKIDFIFSFIVGINKKLRLNIMNNKTKGVTYKAIPCSTDNLKNLDTIGIEVAESRINKRSEPKLVIHINFKN